MRHTRFLALTTGPFSEMGKARGDVKWAVEPVSLESTGRARAGNIDLGVISTLVVFKIVGLSKIS